MRAPDRARSAGLHSRSRLRRRGRHRESGSIRAWSSQHMRHHARSAIFTRIPRGQRAPNAPFRASAEVQSVSIDGAFLTEDDGCRIGMLVTVEAQELGIIGRERSSVVLGEGSWLCTFPDRTNSMTQMQCPGSGPSEAVGSVECLTARGFGPEICSVSEPPFHRHLMSCGLRQQFRVILSKFCFSVLSTQF